MNNLFLRTTVLLLHAAANFLLLTWLTDFDISGSWLATAGFICLLAVLLVFFTWHILKFIFYLKNKLK